MKILFRTILACSLLFTGQAMAQSAGEQTKQSLDAAPVPATVTTEQPTAEAKGSVMEMPANRVSYGFSAGASFGNGFGATYLEPSMRFQVSPRVRAFGSFTYMSVMSQDYAATTPEGGTIMRRTSPSSHYIVNAGVDYLVNDRLILTGMLWKDFSNVPAQSRLYNNFYSPGRQGMDVRATYKITDNFSVTGGVRYSDGASSFYNPFYSPAGFGSSRSSSFWY